MLLNKNTDTAIIYCFSFVGVLNEFSTDIRIVYHRSNTVIHYSTLYMDYKVHSLTETYKVGITVLIILFDVSY